MGIHDAPPGILMIGGWIANLKAIQDRDLNEGHGKAGHVTA